MTISSNEQEVDLKQRFETLARLHHAKETSGCNSQKGNPCTLRLGKKLSAMFCTHL